MSGARIAVPYLDSGRFAGFRGDRALRLGYRAATVADRTLQGAVDDGGWRCRSSQVGAGAGMTVHLESDGRWDLRLAASLSEHNGGFAITVETSRQRGYSGVAVFFAGRAVEVHAEAADSRHPGLELGPPAVPGRAEDLFAGHLLRLTGGDGGLALQASGQRLDGLAADGAGPCGTDPYRLLGAAEAPLIRAALAHVEPEDFASVFEELPPSRTRGWNWRPGATPEAGARFVALERCSDGDAALIADLAGRLEVYGLATRIAAAGEPFTWLWSEPGVAQRQGTGHGAVDLIGAWRDFTVLLGSPPGAAIWPDVPA